VFEPRCKSNKSARDFSTPQLRTPERVDVILFSLLQRLLQISLFDTLYRLFRKRDGGVGCDVGGESANSLFAVLAHQSVRMRLVGFVFGDTRHHHRSSTLVPHDSDGEGYFVFGGAGGASESTRAALAFVAESHGFRRLLYDFDVGFGAALGDQLWSQRVWGFGDRGEHRVD
jgi:hypothetical protein